MTSASLSEIKKELLVQDEATLQTLCLRLAKYKKDNKELLAYLLFDARDEASYIRNIKSEMDTMFNELSDRNLYIVKKMIRKILRVTNKYIRYSGSSQTELDLRIYFCEKVRAANIQLIKGTVLYNLYQQQQKIIFNVLSKLPEDYQADYSNAIDLLRL